jgi:hypothetical protein
LDKLIDLLRRQLPAFWALLLLSPLIQVHIPALYAFSTASSSNAAIAIAIWLMVFEVVVYHLAIPLCGAGLALVELRFVAERLLLTFTPEWYRTHFWERRRKQRLEADQFDPRKKIIMHQCS